MNKPENGLGETNAASAGVVEWNVACVRLERYLAAHEVGDCVRLVELTVEILAEARREVAATGGVPLDVVMRQAQGRVDAWFEGLAAEGANRGLGMEGGNSASQSGAEAGRAAYYGTGVYRRWPSAFLSAEIPEEMAAAVRVAAVKAGPNLEFSSLIRKEVDYGPMEDLARETWATFSWRHVLGAFVLWSVVFAAVYGFFLAFFA